MGPWRKAAAQKTVDWLQMVSVPGRLGAHVISDKASGSNHGRLERGNFLVLTRVRCPREASCRVKTTFSRTFAQRCPCEVPQCPPNRGAPPAWQSHFPQRNKLVSPQECANRNFTAPDGLEHLQHLAGTYRGCLRFEKIGKKSRDKMFLIPYDQKLYFSLVWFQS